MGKSQEKEGISYVEEKPQRNKDILGEKFPDIKQEPHMGKSQKEIRQSEIMCMF